MTKNQRELLMQIDRSNLKFLTLIVMAYDSDTDDDLCASLIVKADETDCETESLRQKFIECED